MYKSSRSVARETTFKIKQLRDELGRFAKRIEDVSGNVLLEEAARIKEQAILEVPVESGDLRDSISVTVSGSKLRKTLTASASSVHRGYDYAGVQHDDETLNHPNGGKAKYIEDPFNAGVSRIIARLEDDLKL